MPADSAPPPIPRPLFETDTPLVLMLEADFSRLEKDRSQESEERPGRAFLETDSGAVSFPVDIRTRGRFRLNRHICSFPPLRLDFPKDSMAGTPLEVLNEVKLVTHCRDNDPYEQNVLEEYLAYRIYGLLTHVAFRVQLALITYRDVKGRDEDISRIAFLIEDDDAMAERLGGEVIEVEQVNPTHLMHRQVGMMYLFQYLIGNTDWALVRPHNMEFVRLEDGFVPVPYDFDFSGFVGAPYAGPSPVVARYITDVRERHFWGICSEKIDYPSLFAHFQEHREAILRLVNTQPELSRWNTRRADLYVREFYRVLDSPREADFLIIQGCRRLGHTPPSRHP